MDHREEGRGPFELVRKVEKMYKRFGANISETCNLIFKWIQVTFEKIVVSLQFNKSSVKFWTHFNYEKQIELFFTKSRAMIIGSFNVEYFNAVSEKKANKLEGDAGLRRNECL